ncbi:N-acetylmannosamine-6-phosphate 2-epimerase [Jiangella sp. DSM 45060]|uniref:N-acetylmannosamine-6-phosphate 2-epimerase n=1 Tax=Jiangella sp. DSM 45060 TaxID=1798224 RepID=UPI00087B1AF5|nr:N-acetylmannosamine-6-phosphate 2-epimerase [Jiangella sp. DSM 45060]SDS34071.1 N-acylglucosamine-6-phosphate 2-epimerase [Jiangella sp. DSM 45060]
MTYQHNASTRPARPDPPGEAAVASIAGGVVVSCQAGPESPLNTPGILAALAQSAERGGAAGFRVDGPANIAAIRLGSDLPIIGIRKCHVPGSDVYITPTLSDAQEIVAAGADVVALDGTPRPRPGGERLETIIERIHDDLRVPVMADIATGDEGLAAHDAGADLVATTLAGYTTPGDRRTGPAFDVLDRLAAAGARCVVEGRIWTVEDVRRCFDAGAYAVVIGSAITVPEFITRRFVGATRSHVELH